MHATYFTKQFCFFTETERKAKLRAFFQEEYSTAEKIFISNNKVLQKHLQKVKLSLFNKDVNENGRLRIKKCQVC